MKDIAEAQVDFPHTTLLPQVKSDQFSRADFNVEEFVRKIVTESIGDGDILATKLKLISLAERTTSKLKESVSQNYSKFIDTAGDVQSLGDDLYQIRSLLSQNKALYQATKDFLIKEEIQVLSTESIDSPQSIDQRSHKSDDISVLERFLEQAEFVGLTRKGLTKGAIPLLHGPVKITTQSSRDHFSAQQAQNAYLCIMSSGELLVLSADDSRPIEATIDELRKRILLNAFDLRSGGCRIEELTASTTTTNATELTNCFKLVAQRGSNTTEALLVEALSLQWKRHWLDALNQSMREDNDNISKLEQDIHNEQKPMYVDHDRINDRLK